MVAHNVFGAGAVGLSKLNVCLPSNVYLKILKEISESKLNFPKGPF